MRSALFVGSLMAFVSWYGTRTAPVTPVTLDHLVVLEQANQAGRIALIEDRVAALERRPAGFAFPCGPQFSVTTIDGASVGAARGTTGAHSSDLRLVEP